MTETEILSAAKTVIKERMASLKSDVRLCVINDGCKDFPAPFPALLYCFSVIDLLGSLYKGDASVSSKVSSQAKSYMTDVMGYSSPDSKLLQKVFRHKLVHLAQPMPKINLGGKFYFWAYVHNNRLKHLITKPLNGNKEYSFTVSIWSLVIDISKSTSKYLSYLQTDLKLQQNFEKAYKEIYL